VDACPTLLLAFSGCERVEEPWAAAQVVDEFSDCQVDDVLQRFLTGEHGSHTQFEAPTVRYPVTRR
jgi:hypothetical protein